MTERVKESAFILPASRPDPQEAGAGLLTFQQPIRELALASYWTDLALSPMQLPQRYVIRPDNTDNTSTFQVDDKLLHLTLLLF